MKHILTILFMLACTVTYSQSTVYLRADTIKVMKQNGNAVLQILNANRDTINGVLINTGNGVTDFKRIRAISASQFVVGTDTITITGATGANLSNASLTANANYSHNWAGFNLPISNIGTLELIAGSGSGTYSTVFGDTNFMAIQHTNNPSILSEIVVGEASSKPFATLRAQDDNSSFPQTGHIISAWQDSIVLRSQRNNDTTQIYLGALLPVGDTSDYVLVKSGNRIKAVPGSLFAGSGDPTAIIKNANYGGYDILNFHTAVDSVIAKQYDSTRYIKLDSNAVKIWHRLDTAAMRADGLLGGNNFANADLTLTDHRYHSLNGKELIISETDGPRLYLGGKNVFSGFSSQALLGNEYDTSFNISQLVSLTANPSGTNIDISSVYQNANDAQTRFYFSASPSGASSAETGVSNAANRTAEINYTVNSSVSQLQFLFGVNPQFFIGNTAGTTAAIDSNKNIFPFVSRDTVLTWNPVTARMERTVVTGGGIDTLYYANQGLTGVTLIHGSNDSIYINRLIAGTNITLTKGTDSAITIAASGGGPASPVNSVQYNNAGAFGGEQAFIYNTSTNQLSLSTALRYPDENANWTFTDSSTSVGRSNSLNIHQITTGNPVLSFSVGDPDAPTEVWTTGIANNVSGDPYMIVPNTSMSSSTAQTFVLHTGGYGAYGTKTANASYKWYWEKSGGASQSSTFGMELARMTGTGTPANGWGLHYDFGASNASLTMRDIGRESWAYTDVANASEDASYRVSLIRAGTLTQAFEVTSLGKFVMPEVTNSGVGIATLVAGTVTVNNSSVTANSRILLTAATPGGTQGFLSYALSAGTSFTITSTSATETSTVAYLIIN